MKLALAICTLIFGAVAMLALNAQQFVMPPSDWAAIRFTVWQAALSALISMIVAIPLARALFRRSFAGRGALIQLLSAPFVLPVLVAVLGLLAIFGRAGPINWVLDGLGFAPISIYGLQGIILANVFFNLPLATRVLLQGWQSIPPERFKLAQSLDMPHAALFRHLEWPMLRARLAGIFATIVLICLSSFTIALTLGGGPKSSTIELSIYQALRFDFDLGRAAMLALVQFGLCGLATVMAGMAVVDTGVGLQRQNGIAGPLGLRKWADIAVIALVAGFLISPILAAILQGLGGLLALPAAVWPALARSVLVALTATLCATVAAFVMAWAPARQGWVGFAAMLPLATSGLVLGTGLFLMLRAWLTPSAVALPLTILVNAMMSLPYLFRLLSPEVRRLQTSYAPLIDSLGLPMMTRWRWIILPLLAPVLGYGAGLAAALSMGDLGVMALFADGETATLPLLVQRLMGAYQMQAAASVALILVVAGGALFFALDAWGRRYAET